MELQKEDLSEIFRRIAERDESFQQALGIVKQNTAKGKTWLIGGFLYRNLASYLYGTTKPAKDFDFIVESPNPKIVLPIGWQVNRSRFGNPKFTKEDKTIEIDFVPLEKVYSIMKRQLPATIQNYLSGVPLNIHYLVYDTRQGVIEGKVGIQSLEQKVVRVYNLEMAEDAARLYNTTVNDIIKKKARELGFKAELV